MLRNLILICLSLAAVSASSVVQLTKENFDTIVNGKKHVFVKFFAPWCGHCKAMAPAWEQLAETFKAEPDVVIADVDATVERELGDNFKVQGYPTLKYFKKGSVNEQEFEGGRAIDPMVDYVNKMAGTFRKKGGELMEEAGRIEKLDAFVSEFGACGSLDCKKAVVKNVESALSSLKESEKKLGAFYKKTLEKAAADEKSLTKEQERLTRLKDGGNVGGDQKTFVFQRINIIKSIIKALSGKGSDEL